MLQGAAYPAYSFFPNGTPGYDPARAIPPRSVARAVWSNVTGGRTQGVGVRFPGDEKTRALRVRIEEILGTSLSSSKPTQTL